VASLREHPSSTGSHAAREGIRAVPLPAATPSEGPGRSLNGFVEEAAKQITRFSALEAFAACAADGVILDSRSEDAREGHGVIPGSLHIPRTVLEWRVALDSPWRNAHLGGPDQLLILICDHGYSSILAARNLVELGFDRAGDIVGGFAAWEAYRLPIARCRHRASTLGALPGTGPPEQGVAP
jgi:rhodanese-related sulfurtransferase